MSEGRPLLFGDFPTFLDLLYKVIASDDDESDFIKGEVVELVHSFYDHASLDSTERPVRVVVELNFTDKPAVSAGPIWLVFSDFLEAEITPGFEWFRWGIGKRPVDVDSAIIVSITWVLARDFIYDKIDYDRALIEGRYSIVNRFPFSEAILPMTCLWLILSYLYRVHWHQPV